MQVKNFPTSPVSRIVGGILVIALSLSACASPPTTITIIATSTQILPSSPPSTPTTIPPTSTSTSEPRVPVKSLDEIIGTWRTHCGGGPCDLKLYADGTYRMQYVTPTEGQGVTFIDGGKITFAEGVFHLESTHGYCEAMPNGYFQAFLTLLDGKPFNLEFTLTQPDECSDRSRALLYPMRYVDQ